jgi:hypothetical protein
MEAIDTKTIGKYRIDIIPDETPSNPREDFDNLGTMVCFHGNYILGDKHDYRHQDYTGWEDMKNAIIKNEDVGVILPLYLYDHSGITMNTEGFHCPWDSGQVGWIFISKSKMREEYSYKRISEKLRRRVKQYLKAEVHTYDQYLTGDVYGYRITDTEKDEEVDSCWGYYGSDVCMAEAESITTYMLAKVDYEETLENLDD